MYSSLEDLIEKEGLEFIQAPKPDGSFELDGVDISWDWFGENLAALQKVDPNRVFTVIDGDDGELYISHGFHRVNRLYYLVSKEPFIKDWLDDVVL